MTSHEPQSDDSPAQPQSVLYRICRLEPGERVPVAWACLTLFVFMTGYYMLRPIRDAMGLESGDKNLAWLMMVTSGVTLLASLGFAWLFARATRARLVLLVFNCYALIVLIFSALLHMVPQDQQVILVRSYFVFVSIVGLMGVSILWSVMIDTFSREQAKRLFPLFALGTSLGAMAGSLITRLLLGHLHVTGLLILAALLISLAAFCSLVLCSHADVCKTSPHPAPSRQNQIQSALQGVKQVADSRYLQGICLFFISYTLIQTIIYLVQARIVQESLMARPDRIAFFANLNLTTNILTVLIELTLAWRILKKLGLGGTLIILPAVTGLGLVVLALQPILSVLFVFQVIRKSLGYGLVRPAREALFSPLTRDEQYAAKNLIDTFIYRLGDNAGAGLYWLLTVQIIGLSLSAITVIALPVTLVWGYIGFQLGRSADRYR